MNYTDQQIDALLEKANEVGLISSFGIIRTLKPEVQEEYMKGLRSGLRKVLEELPAQEDEQVVYGVLCQPWTETERGWGQRPDGYTLHPTAEARQAFIDSYWAKEKIRNPSGITPDEYSFPDGDAYVVEVDRETYEAVHATAVDGIWGTGNRALDKANRRDLKVGETKS